MPGVEHAIDAVAITAQLAACVREAGALALSKFRSPFKSWTKGVSSPVSEVDIAVDELLRETLSRIDKSYGWLSEESADDPARAAAERVWVVDPIDGTRAFISGRPIFGTLIALTVEGWPMLGVIDQPILKERWTGVVGQPTLFNGTPARTRLIKALDEALLATTSPALFNDDQLHAFEHLDAQVRSTVLGGDCYNYGCLASGHIDVVVEAGLKIHDFAALVPVVEGAGGRMCDWAGDPLTNDSIGEVIAAGEPARIDDIIDALACRGH